MQIFRNTSWKIALTLVVVFLFELVFTDTILGIPRLHRKAIDLPGVGSLILAIFVLAVATATIISIFWMNERSFRERVVYLIPRLTIFFTLFFMIFMYGVRYYYATVKLGLDI